MSGPSLRDRLRPLELVGIAGVLGVFTAVVVLIATRELQLAAILGGVAFIIGLLVLAMLALAAGEPTDPNDGPILDRPHRGDRPR